MNKAAELAKGNKPTEEAAPAAPTAEDYLKKPRLISKQIIILKAEKPLGFFVCKKINKMVMK